MELHGVSPAKTEELVVLCTMPRLHERQFRRALKELHKVPGGVGVFFLAFFFFEKMGRQPGGIFRSVVFFGKTKTLIDTVL